MNKLKLFKIYMQGNTIYFLLSWLSIILQVAFAAVLPLLTAFYLDYVIEGLPLDEIKRGREFAVWLHGIFIIHGRYLILPIIAVLTAIQGLFFFLRGKMAAVACENSSRNLRNRLYEHILHQPYEFQANTQTGDLIQRCTSDVETVQGFMNSHAVEAISISVQVIVVLFIMLSINPPYTLLSTMLIPVILLLTIRFFLSMMKIFLAADEAEGEMSTALQENLSGVRVVKAFAAQQLEITKFTDKNAHYRDRVMDILRLMAGFWSSSDFLCMLQFAVVILAGAWGALNGYITIGTLIAFSSYAGMLIWPVRGLGQMMGFMGQAFVALGRIKEIFDYPIENANDGINELTIKGEIIFENVSFGYEADNPVIDNISLTIPAGKTTAVLGATGSGKSTLVHLLLRLYDYQSGSIKLDGVDLKNISRRLLRQRIGLVLQEPYLFSRDLADNIRLGRAGAADTEVMEAARMASVHESIRRFERGYQTIVGERGVTLSGGQRQRIAIARTLLRKPSILIFDDSLSAVDSSTDAAIRLALKKCRGNITTLLISHRITTLAEADQILVMDQGRIVQSGRHEELIKEDGIYQKIWRIQSSSDSVSEVGDHK
jgi:ATP-binding cassette subfamily B protein